MFSPLSALSALGSGALKGYTEEGPKIFDMMGMEALGRAFQAQPGPIDAQNAQKFAQGPQAPMPGQASMPSQPAGPPPAGPQAAMGGPPAPFSGGAGGPMPQPSPMQGPPMGAPQAPPGGPQGPPQMPPGGPQGVGQPGMPQLDLNTLVQRLQKTSPNLPPQAMLSALTRAVPLLNMEGRQQLAQFRLQMQQENMGIREKMLQLQQQKAGQQSEAQDKKQGQIQEIGDAIINGDQPPNLTGMYRDRKDIQAYLAQKGFKLAKAQQEWSAAQKQISSLNGPQMTRFAGLAKSVDKTIDEVKSLAEEMDNSGIPLANKAKLMAYMQAQGNSPNGQLAARYIGAVNTLKEEFANLAQGGYAPTESVWALANRQINEDYGVKQMNASLDEIQRLIRYRVNAIPNFNTLGPSGANRYTGAGGGNQPDMNVGAGQPATNVQNRFPGGGGGGSPEDQAALKWANDNPTDPRSAKIKQKLGVQ